MPASLPMFDIPIVSLSAMHSIPVKFLTILLLCGLRAGTLASRLQVEMESEVHDLDPSLASFYRYSRAESSSTMNGSSSSLWLLADEYAGPTFFDRWKFFTGRDPTNGHVDYIDRDAALASKLVYTRDDGVVIMKSDNETWLEPGTYRKSVRISSHAQYNMGLFVLDLNKVPWGCGTWPAFWTLGNGVWPNLGEIDIIEGVHDNEHNQVAWHTKPGCVLTPEANFTGSIVTSNDGKQHLECNGLINNNAGCGITEWSRASYGVEFDAQGGGVFAMKWDEEGIAVWSFYRPTVPRDIVEGNPDPSNWGFPSALLLPDNCPMHEYFANHSIIFDITFCGDWAGNSYATSGCPGTCEDRLMDPANFDDAVWSINWLRVYRKQFVRGVISNEGFIRGKQVIWRDLLWVVGGVVTFLFIGL